MKIPSSFKIGGITYTVVYENLVHDGEYYGEFISVKQQIVLARKVIFDETEYEVSEEMKKQTFLHELIHCFQFSYGIDYDEIQANNYANFLLEFINSKE